MKRHGLYSQQEDIQICYQKEDLIAKVHFLNKEHGMSFQRDILEWRIHKDLVHLGDIVVNPKEP